MIILGIAFLSDASAAILRDGELIAAVSEERLNREKLWHGVPHRAIDEVLRLSGLSLEEVDLIATHGKAPQKPDPTPFLDKEQDIRVSNLPNSLRQSQIEFIQGRHSHEQSVLGERTPAYLSEIEAYGIPMEVVAHHTAHAASAYYASGWDTCYVLTADGWGEDASSTVWHANDGVMNRIGRSHTIDSLGYFYGSVTKALGFVPHRHEGKVLGLAALCENPASYPIFRDMVSYEKDRCRFIGHMENGVYRPGFDNPELAEQIAAYPREDVAAGTQRRLEEVVCQLVAELGSGSRIRLALAGGLFANVRLNQCLRELPNVAEVYVFPNMGDGGLSVGAAWLAHWRKSGQRPAPLSTAFLGGDISDRDVADAIAKGGVSVEHTNDIERRVAELLADGQIVARAGGPMEYGPRALGNRSILCQATDHRINDWLNERLQRSEFMPFAPATLAEDADVYYRDMAGGRAAAQYMTMTFDCTEKMKKAAPAAVHVDGTARPQLVSPEAYSSLHKILTDYRALTGHSSVVNTSFNMHEEPVVCTADDAIRAFRSADLPWLALGSFLIKGQNDVITS